MDRVPPSVGWKLPFAKFFVFLWEGNFFSGVGSVFNKVVGLGCLGLGVRVRMKGVKFENFPRWGLGGGGLGVAETHRRRLHDEKSSIFGYIP